MIRVGFGIFLGIFVWTCFDKVDSQSTTGIAPPKITESSPTFIHQEPGSTVTLFCRATGSTPLTLSWSKNTEPIQRSNRVVISGSELRIQLLRHSDGGQYMCTFQNTAGSVSQIIKLVVDGGAYIDDAPTNLTVIEGQRITMPCHAVAYPANITYRWFRNSQSVQSMSGFGQRVLMQSDGSLLITAVQKADIGWFLCRPSNGIGQDPEATAYLNVTYLPEVQEKLLQNRRVLPKGYPAQIPCPVIANPPVSHFIWIKNSQEINFSNIRVSLLSDGTLVITRVELSDAGSYSCTPFSSLGRGRSSPNVQVLVQDPPYFTVRPRKFYQREPKQTITMPCVAVGSPPPAITWRKVDGILRLGNRAQILVGNLTVTDLNKNDHGEYECVATNSITSIITSTMLIIEMTTPHAPYNISIEPNVFSATVSWMPAYDGGYPQAYLLWYRSLDGPVSGWQTISVRPADATMFTVYMLEADTRYEFKVLSRNSLGDGMYSNVESSRTLGGNHSSTTVSKLTGYIEGIATALPTNENGVTYIPPIVQQIGPHPLPPRNVTVTSLNGAVNVSWLAPEVSNVTVFYYEIEYRSEDSVKWQRTKQVLAPTTWKIIDNLSNGKKYVFRVFSCSVLAYSEPSPMKEIEVSSIAGGLLSEAAIGGLIGGILFFLAAALLAIIAVMCNRRKKKKAQKFGNINYYSPNDMDGAVVEGATEWPANSQRPTSPARIGGGDPIGVSLGSGIYVLPDTRDPAHWSQTMEEAEQNRLSRTDHGRRVPPAGGTGRQPRQTYLDDENGFTLSFSGSLPQHSISSMRIPKQPQFPQDRSDPQSPAHRSILKHSFTSSPPLHDSVDHGQDFSRPGSSFPGEASVWEPPGSDASYDGPYHQLHPNGDEGLPYPRHSSRKPLSRSPGKMTDHPPGLCDISSVHPSFSDSVHDASEPHRSHPAESYSPTRAAAVYPRSPREAISPSDQDQRSRFPRSPRETLFDPADRSLHPQSPRSRDTSQAYSPRLGPEKPQRSPHLISQISPHLAAQRSPHHPHSRSPHHPHSPFIGDGYESRSQDMSPYKHSPDEGDKPLSDSRSPHIAGSYEPARQDLQEFPHSPNMVDRYEPLDRPDGSDRRELESYVDTKYPPYTRDHLQGTVDRLRQGAKPWKPKAPQHLEDSDMDSFPSLYPTYDTGRYLRPSKRADLERYGDLGDSHTSVSSSGRGSISGRARLPPLDPDSMSSGVGSRNTSGSSSRIPRGHNSVSSVTTPHDTSLESSPFTDGHRRDISTDENYEFDPVSPFDSDISPARYGGDQSLKPSQNSHYDEQRFERLREEFNEYRRRQREHMQQSQLSEMDSEML